MYHQVNISKNLRSVQRMCFYQISEKTEFISLHNINWLVVITETECAYWAVRAEFLNNIQVFLVFNITNNFLECDAI